MRNIVRTYTSWIDPHRFWPAAFLALAIKGTLFLGLLLRFRSPAFPGYWGGYTFDSASYIDPVEHLLSQGTYDPDYRMPGYGVPYGLFRIFLEQAQALNAMLIVQLLFSAISTVLLARIAFKATRSVQLFHIVFWAFAISTFVSLYDVIPMTESLSASVMIIGVYMSFLSLDRDRPALAFVAGILFTWLAFLRPVMIPLLGLPVLFFLLKNDRLFRRRLVHVAMFLLPCLVIESAWIARNHSVHGRLIPLSTSWMMPHFLGTPTYRMCEVVQAFGGSLVWWDPDAEIRAFNVRDKGEPAWLADPERKPTIPTYATTPEFPMDSLVALADAVQRWEDADETDPQRKRYNNYIMERGARYIASFKQAHPFQYHVVAPLRILAKFTLHSGTYLDLPHPRNMGERVAKGFYSGLYLTTVLFGSLGALVALFHRRWPRWALMVPLIFGYGLLVHPFVLRFCEYRYLVPFYPWALVMAAWFLHGLFSRQRRSALPLHTPGIRRGTVGSASE